MNNGGVYMLLWPSGYFYVGQATHFERRRKAHISDMKRGQHSNNKVQNVFNKHGSPEFIIMDTCADGLLNTYEQYYIDHAFANEQNCNLSPSASSCLGIKKGDDFKEKRRAYMLSDRNPTKDVGHTDEARAKMSKSHTGKVLTKIHAERIHAHIQRGKHPKARKVHRPSTGESWACINDCADATGISQSHLRKCINGERPNTIGIYLENAI